MLTGLKVSSFAWKYVFYRTEHNAKRGLHKTEFWRSWNAKAITLSWLFHSHQKRKDSLEDSLGRVLFSAELEFPKILVPRLPQHTSNVNMECAGKSE